MTKQTGSLFRLAVSTVAPATALLLLFSGNLTASSVFHATGSDADGSLDATATFAKVNCAVACALDITLQNNIANPTGAGQLISDLAFNLSDGGTSLTSPGTLSNSISNGNGGPVTVVDFQHGDSTTTTKPGRWQFSYVGGFYFLNDLTGGQPVDMIIGGAPSYTISSYSNANSSITGPHNPSLGTTMFEVTNITGLTASTLVSNVYVSFGTSYGEGFAYGQQAVPEPATLALMGLGLLGLGTLGRRLRKPK